MEFKVYFSMKIEAPNMAEAQRRVRELLIYAEGQQGKPVAADYVSVNETKSS